MSRILVVDDEEHIANLIRDCLIAEGHEVITANNGLLAYHIIKKSDFDLLVTDIIMPEMDGLELIQKVKKIKPRTRIIAMSAGGDHLKAE
ncbi:MAG: response regulator, partial [Gammaproteobacteria bacterium]|nr:response regulator [Gammaproteobacteria bacterium]